MTRKASPSILLHKSEVTYMDTGVSKNLLNTTAVPKLIGNLSFCTLIAILSKSEGEKSF